MRVPINFQPKDPEMVEFLDHATGAYHRGLVCYHMAFFWLGAMFFTHQWSLGIAAAGSGFLGFISMCKYDYHIDSFEVAARLKDIDHTDRESAP